MVLAPGETSVPPNKSAYFNRMKNAQAELALHIQPGHPIVAEEDGGSEGTAVAVVAGSELRNSLFKLPFGFHANCPSPGIGPYTFHTNANIKCIEQVGNMLSVLSLGNCASSSSSSSVALFPLASMVASDKALWLGERVFEFGTFLNIQSPLVQCSFKIWRI